MTEGRRDGGKEEEGGREIVEGKRGRQEGQKEGLFSWDCPSLTSDFMPTLPSVPALVWRAPELLRDCPPPAGTQRGDVYSFGIIVQEVVYRNGPFFIPNSSLKAKGRYSQACMFVFMYKCVCL